jgi:DNA-binding IclR family transcriptional regulator
MTRQPLTDKQLAVYVFMKDYFRENDELPPMGAIVRQFGLTANSTASGLQQQLVRKGYIEKNAAGRYRFVRDTSESDFRMALRSLESRKKLRELIDGLEKIALSADDFGTAAYDEDVP